MDCMCGELGEYVCGFKGYVWLFFNMVVMIEFLLEMFSVFLVVYFEVDVDLEELVSYEIVEVIV